MDAVKFTRETFASALRRTGLFTAEVAARTAELALAPTEVRDWPFNFCVALRTAQYDLAGVCHFDTEARYPTIVQAVYMVIHQPSQLARP